MPRLPAAAPSLIVAGLLLFVVACSAGRTGPESARTGSRPVAAAGGVVGSAGGGESSSAVAADAVSAAEIRVSAGATSALPALSPAFHRGRREALRRLLPAHSVAVLFAAPRRLLAADVEYPFHQDPDFYYLTGLREPGALLVLFADPQPSPLPGGPPITEQLYVRPRDAEDELWNGARLGPEGAARTLGFGRVLSSVDFVRRPPDWRRFARVCFLPPIPGDDGRNLPADSTELPDLRRAFERAAGLPTAFDVPREQLLARLRAWGRRSPARFLRWLNQTATDYPAVFEEPVLRAWGAEPDSAKRAQILRRLPVPGRFDVFTLDAGLDDLREIKQPEELVILRRAIDLTVSGHLAALRALTPATTEAELEGIQQLVYRRGGARADGYWPIVGAGVHGCVLHYIDNDPTPIGTSLVVMDVGASLGGYTADVTRTAPGSGRFNPEQRQIYELVLRAQQAGIKECVAGNDFSATGKAAQKVIGRGLVLLGVIAEPDSAYRYFPHGTSHYLGLDVHDRGTYGPLRPNSVITVEPGIYIPPGSPCDPKWWGIGCRIEDDMLITDGAPENLSDGAPRTITEVEALLKKPQ